MPINPLNGLDDNEPCPTCDGRQPSCPVCHPTEAPECMDCGRTPCACDKPVVKTVRLNHGKRRRYAMDIPYLTQEAREYLLKALTAHQSSKSTAESIPLPIHHALALVQVAPIGRPRTYTEEEVEAARAQAKNDPATKKFLSTLYGKKTKTRRKK